MPRRARRCALRRCAGAVFVAVLRAAVSAPLAPLAAQQPPAPPPNTPNAQNANEKLRSQREELDKIRTERADLQKRMRELQTTVHDLSEERTNIERQRDVTARAVRSLDAQITSLGEEEKGTTSDLVRAQDELAVKRSVLEHRVKEIYKRGALYSAEAMLSAQSFGELIARYKYLHLVAQRDRALVLRVETLGMLIERQRESLLHLRGDVELSRQEKADEEKRLRTLEEQRGRSLAQAQAKAKATEQRLQQIAKDESRLTDIVLALETERRRAAGRTGGALPTTSPLRTTDIGRLDWPVEGEILYRFGRAVNPNNTAIRWNGVGIAAPAGSLVKAVAAGSVAEVLQSFGTYGPTVVLQHGAGAYSIYSSLGQISVAKGAKIAKGQALGTVGTTDPELGPHLHFEIRPDGRQAVDPLEWLRSRK